MGEIDGIDINDILKIYGMINNNSSENTYIKNVYGEYLIPFEIVDYEMYFGKLKKQESTLLKNGIPINWDEENF